MSTSALDFYFFFFNDTATTEIYTLSLHDALPICACTGSMLVDADQDGLDDDCEVRLAAGFAPELVLALGKNEFRSEPDRKSTRLNSSHTVISYAGFCLKKKRNANI